MVDESEDQTQDSGEGASEADIDAMLAGAAGDAPTPASESPEPAAPPPEAESSGDPQAISQSDIDALMGNETVDEPVPAADPPPASSEATEEAPSGAVGQSDIDALLAGAAAEVESAEEPAGPPAGDASSVDQSDIDALLQAAGAAAEDTAATEPTESTPDDRTDTFGRPFDEDAAAMQAAIDEEREQAAAAAPAPAPVPAAGPDVAAPSTTPVALHDFSDSSIPDVDPKRVSMLNDVNLRVKIELGRTRMLLEDVLKLDDGSVVELDKLAGDPVDVFVNDRLIARGEVLILNDNFCVRISEVLSHDPHRVSA